MMPRSFVALLMLVAGVIALVLVFGEHVDNGGNVTPATCPGCEPVEVAP
jgi:hypothetical protein